MKLYTEEQVLKAIMNGYLQGIERHPDYIPIEQSILKDLKPIELPSIEEIINESDKQETLRDTSIFIKGAKWIIDKIKNQQ